MDVAIVVGANDSVNPDAGMPVIQVWKAKLVVFLKRTKYGFWICWSGQSSVLQTKHGYASWRCEENVV